MTDMRTVFSDAASALLDEDPLAAVVLAEISADLFAKAAARVNGRDHAALAAALRVTSAGADSGASGPQLVVATVEGKA